MNAPINIVLLIVALTAFAIALLVFAIIERQKKRKNRRLIFAKIMRRFQPQPELHRDFAQLFFANPAQIIDITAEKGDVDERINRLNQSICQFARNLNASNPVESKALERFHLQMGDLLKSRRLAKSPGSDQIISGLEIAEEEGPETARN